MQRTNNIAWDEWIDEEAQLLMCLIIEKVHLSNQIFHAFDKYTCSLNIIKL